MNSIYYSLYATSVLSFGFGAIVWVIAARRRLTGLWCLFCFAVGAWALGFAKMLRAPQPGFAYAWEVFMYLGANVLPILFFQFATELTSLRSPKILAIGYLIAIALEVACLGGYEVGVKIVSGMGYYTQPGPVFHLLAIYYLSFVIYGLWILRLGILRADGRVRKQFQSIFIGTALGFSGGGTTFFLSYGIPLLPYGVHLVPIYILTASYAIVRHQLMDISVVVRRTLLYSFVVATLGLFYLALLHLGAKVLEPYLGFPAFVSSILATGLVVLLSQPVRLRVQAIIDRAFMYERIRALPSEIRDEVLHLYSSSLTHELKTPLAHILAPSELILLQLQDVSDGKQDFGVVFPKVRDRIKYIIAQVLEANRRFEAIRQIKPLTNEEETVSIKEVAISAIAQLDELRERAGTAVSIDLATDLPAIQGHRKQLEIVFINILKNAMEANAKQVMINAIQKGRSLFIHLRDSGDGIAPEYLARIFEPNFTTKGVNGTGIGLFLCREILERHDGTLEVSSQQGRGTTFTLRLPLGQK